MSVTQTAIILILILIIAYLILNDAGLLSTTSQPHKTTIPSTMPSYSTTSVQTITTLNESSQKSMGGITALYPLISTQQGTPECSSVQNCTYLLSNSTEGAPMQIRVTVGNGMSQGVLVTFSATSGYFIGNGACTTGSDGTCNVSYFVPYYQNTIVITASEEGFSANLDLSFP